MNFFIGLLFMFLSALSYGMSSILIKYGYNQTALQPAQLLSLQNIISVFSLWAIMLSSYGWPRLNKRQLKDLALQGILGNMGISVCFFWAAERVDVSLLSIILFTYPGLVLAYQVLVEKRRVLPMEWLALGFVLCGAVLAVDPFHSGIRRVDGIGLLLAVGAAATYAFMNIWGEKLTHDLPPQVITAITSTVSTIGLFLFIVRPHEVFARSLSTEEWLVIAGTAFLSTILPMNLMYLGIRRIGAFYASMISVAELPCILLLAYFWLNEHMNGYQIIGGILIIASMFILQRGGEKKEQAADGEIPGMATK
jgi:drug/metabolite transporter (DMT)-like permease